MAETLVIRCHDLVGTRVDWRIKGGLQILSGSGSLADTAELAKGRRVLVLIPASEALITQVTIPTKNRQRLLQAIPFALETELTQDVEQLHFAIGATVPDDATPVIVISRIRLEKWLSSLESHGIEPLGLYLDLLCLPHAPDEWSLLVEDEMVLVHTSAHQGFCTDRENAGEMLEIALQQAGDNAPRKLKLFRFGETDLVLPEHIEIERIALDSHEALVIQLADELQETPQINLLQSEYKRVDKFTLQWKRWLPAAVLTVVALLLSLTLNLFDYYHYQRKSQQLDQQIQQVFKQAFPDIKRIVDPKVQMEQQLKSMRGGGMGGAVDFAALFTPAATVIKGSPDTQLENVSFRDGQLDLQLTIKELQALEKLKQAIEAKKLSVEIRTANASGNRVTSHLRISEAGK